jgi:hypothetical protein
MPTIHLENVTIEIDFDGENGKILDTVVSFEDLGNLRSYPDKNGIKIIINPLGDGWKKYIKEA